MVCGGSFVVVDCAKIADADRTKSAAPVRTAFITFISSSPCISAIFPFGPCVHHKGRMPMKHRLARKVAQTRWACCKPHEGRALRGNEMVRRGQNPHPTL